MNLIRRKILEKVATFTSYSSLHEEDENSNSDIVITTGSDADSSGDGKVTATSVDGEDDVVDVTMKDANSSDERGAKSAKPEFPLRRFGNRRPKFLNTSTYLKPDLQNMFEMTYYTENNDLIPAGWSSMSDDKSYPNLADRDPRLQAEIRRAEERGRSRSSDDSAQGSDDDQPDIRGVTRMADESSDEDSEPKVSLPRSFPFKIYFEM